MCALRGPFAVSASTAEGVRFPHGAGPGDDDDDELPIGDPPDDDEGDDWDDEDEDEDEEPLQASVAAAQHRHGLDIAAQWRPTTRRFVALCGRFGLICYLSPDL
jgi:hypothetical protein